MKEKSVLSGLGGGVLELLHRAVAAEIGACKRGAIAVAAMLKDSRCRWKNREYIYFLNSARYLAGFAARIQQAAAADRRRCGS